MNVKEVVKNYGGTVSFARICGVKPQVVTNWKARGRIPSDVILNTPALAIQYLAEKEAQKKVNKNI